MRKLVVTCECGQRMQVPRSAVGKTGLCPTCGQSITITNDNATAAPPPSAARGSRPLNNARQSWWQGRAAPSEDARRRFGEAVDLYYLGRYAEALAIFDALAKQFPGNPDIESGRTQCIAGLRRSPAALTMGTAGSSGTVPADARLDAETVKRVILDKMIGGATEATQLQAAELAARILGLFGNGKHVEDAAAPEPDGESNNTSDESGSADGSAGGSVEAESPSQEN